VEFSGTTIEMVSKLRLAPAVMATEQEKMKWEKELLGLYVTAHPFAFYQKIMDKILTYTKDLNGHPRNTWVIVGGVIDSTKKKITRAGKAMMFVRIQDTSGGLELLVFPKTYEITKEVWKEGSIVCVVGKTGEEEGDDKLFVEKAYEITPENVHSIVAQMQGHGGSTTSSTQAVSPATNSVVSSAMEIKQVLDGIELILSPEQLKQKADHIKQVLAKYPGAKQVYLKIGDKKIKTSFSVDGSEAIYKDLEKVF
jgi:DNA polymerase-3 subunit alpha